VSSKRHQATASIGASSTTDSGTCKLTLKFVPTNGPLSNKSHNTLLVWEYFAHFDPIACPNKDLNWICMVCQEEGEDKEISVGNRLSTGALEKHLLTHPDKYYECTAKKAKQSDDEHNTNASKPSPQTVLTSHFKPINDVCKSLHNHLHCGLLTSVCLSILESWTHLGNMIANVNNSENAQDGTIHVPSSDSIINAVVSC
jgi:hypothetical protein